MKQKNTTYTTSSKKLEMVESSLLKIALLYQTGVQILMILIGLIDNDKQVMISDYCSRLIQITRAKPLIYLWIYNYILQLHIISIKIMEILSKLVLITVILTKSENSARTQRITLKNALLSFYNKNGDFI